MGPWLPAPGGCLEWLRLWAQTSQSSHNLPHFQFPRGSRIFTPPPPYAPNLRVSLSCLPSAKLNWFTQGLSSTLQIYKAKMITNTTFFFFVVVVVKCRVFKNFLLLFNYSCMPFLPISPPHPSQTPLPPLPPPSPLILSMCPLSEIS